MPKTISLNPEQLTEQHRLLTDLTVKYADGISKMRMYTTDLESSMRGGQGDACLAVLNDMSNVYDEIRGHMDTLRNKLAQRTQTIEDMQKNTGKFSNLSDQAQSVSNAVRNRK